MIEQAKPTTDQHTKPQPELLDALKSLETSGLLDDILSLHGPDDEIANRFVERVRAGISKTKGQT